MWTRALILFVLALPLAAELPEFYKSVDRILWVVDDIDKTVAGWQKLGLMDVNTVGDTGEGFSWSVGRFGDVVVDLIQPGPGNSGFAAFRKAHGQGVLGLLHRVLTQEAFDAEVARMKALGVGTLDGGPIGESGARYILFDTVKEGKYAIGLIYSPGAPGWADLLAPPPMKPGARKVTQYAFVVKDNLDSVSKYWAKLGWPEMSVTHPTLWDLKYRGQPGQFDSKLGWQRHGKVVYEWILPLKGPTVYADHLEKHGEGFHHLAFNTEDMDKEIATWVKAGYPMTQAGAWGEKDKPGYGRFAYHDTHAIGGTDIELLWNFKAK